MLAAYEFWRDLQKRLQARGYEHIGISAGNNSEYMVPAGTANQVTWRSKPELSFRLAENWSWFANADQCDDLEYIQCLNTSMPPAHPRQNGPLKGSSPVKGWAVAFFRDGHYVTIAGNRWDPITGAWETVSPKCTEELLDRLLDDRRFPPSQ